MHKTRSFITAELRGGTGGVGVGVKIKQKLAARDAGAGRSKAANMVQ